MSKPKKNTYKQEQNQSKRGAKRPQMPKLGFKSPDFGSSMAWIRDKKFTVTAGFFLLLLSLIMALSFVSFLFTGRADQSLMEGNEGLLSSAEKVRNWLGYFGAWLSHKFIYQWFGLASYMLIPLTLAYGVKLTADRTLFPLRPYAWLTLFALFWLSTFLGFWTSILTSDTYILGFNAGGIGFWLSTKLGHLLGWATIFFLLFLAAVFSIYFLGVEKLMGIATGAGKVRDFIVNNPQKNRPNTSKQTEKQQTNSTQTHEAPTDDEQADDEAQDLVDTNEHAAQVVQFEKQTKLPFKDEKINDQGLQVIDTTVEEQQNGTFEDAHDQKIRQKSEELVEQIGQYDPRLDLSMFRLPTAELLDNIVHDKVKVTTEELEENKNRIVDTLKVFGIEIERIKAIIGPTVTLYEIVPKAGNKISKIKNLEDDIALNLAALGIRIIAPMPGQGTIGIEVPNKNPEIVPLRTIITHEKFALSKAELPVILGKTISNAIFVADLAKMPHLLMAGATGQGKSVGLNVILTSLLYKKHPSELKFVLIDPKKVELSLFEKIERHYLAKLPDSEEAIITDTKKVVHTLNSLCIEMDVRYNLLKEASCRNIKEYNNKFLDRKLNPEDGHKFLPYIVVIIDELADLMMTAGKEVEVPIARLAQLARAVGLHLVVATQRPSVNVITGIIKANFPARLSFKVTQKVDSRTILDTGGAEQLIGRGDMLLSNGSDIVRLQCPFVDTHEIERICDFIGAQKGYASAYLLPEFEDENKEQKAVDLSKKDALFDEAARLVVSNQQGSTSLIQRKLSLGYNRAGRIMDQLEAAGIVGAFEGSKARQVLVHDLQSLEQLLKDLPTS